MISFYGNNTADINHFLKVSAFAEIIGKLEQLDDMEQDVKVESLCKKWRRHAESVKKTEKEGRGLKRRSGGNVKLQSDDTQ